jgi:LPS-assembly protein
VINSLRLVRRIFLIACSATLPCFATSQAHAQSQAGPFDNCEGNPRFAYTGQGEKGPDSGLVRGAVEIECNDVQLFADEVHWDAKTIYASGKLLLVQKSQGLTVYAERMEMDRATRFGTFFNAQGFARLADKQPTPTPFGSQEPDIQFKGEKFERIGPETYRLTSGMFSTCDQPTPRWQMTGSKATVVLNKRVVLKNAVLKVKDVPLLYLPVLYYPINKEGRATGFLMPSYGNSSSLGQGISNAFFLVLGRSQDATFYHTFSSKAGNTFGTDYRYVASPGSDGNALFKVIGTKAEYGADGVTVARPATRSYKIDGGVNQALPGGFRLVGNVNYFTSIVDHQRYEQNVYDYSNRSRGFGVGVYGTIAKWYRLSVRADQQDYYSGRATASRQGRAPQVDLSVVDRPLGQSRIYFGANAQVAYLIQQPDITVPASNQSLLRFDATPRVRVPLSSLSFLSATSSTSLRVTSWNESRDLETGLQVPVPITRTLVDFRTDVLGPVFSRIFTPKDGGYAERFKHLIEPRVSLQWLSPFDRDNEIVRIDYGVDNLPSGTMTIVYSLTNRLLARRKAPAGAPPGVGGVIDVLTVSISQSRYSDLKAALNDPNYPAPSVTPYSPLQIAARVSPANAFNATFQTYIDPTYRKPQQFTATASILRTITRVTAIWSKTQFIPGAENIYGNPANAAHSVGGSVTIQPRGGRLSGNYSANFDLKNKDFVQQRIVASYNAQCCGVTMDYQTRTLRSFGTFSSPADRSFGISFSLAGIGSFSNPFGSFGDNTGRR